MGDEREGRGKLLGRRGGGSLQCRGGEEGFVCRPLGLGFGRRRTEGVGDMHEPVLIEGKLCGLIAGGRDECPSRLCSPGEESGWEGRAKPGGVLPSDPGENCVGRRLCRVEVVVVVVVLGGVGGGERQCHLS